MVHTLQNSSCAIYSNFKHQRNPTACHLFYTKFAIGTEQRAVNTRPLVLRINSLLQSLKTVSLLVNLVLVFAAAESSRDDQGS